MLPSKLDFERTRMPRFLPPANRQSTESATLLPILRWGAAKGPPILLSTTVITARRSSSRCPLCIQLAWTPRRPVNDLTEFQSKRTEMV